MSAIGEIGIDQSVLTGLVGWLRYKPATGRSFPLEPPNPSAATVTVQHAPPHMFLLEAVLFHGAVVSPTLPAPCRLLQYADKDSDAGARHL